MVFRTVIFTLILQIAGNYFLSAQQSFFVLHQTPQVCEMGTAQLTVPGNFDSLQIVWSTGASNVHVIHGLEAGEYNVRIKSMRKHDTLIIRKDTTIYFTIEKEQCPLLIPKYFSPNGDGYNDLLLIGNIEKYPDFELNVYNKWGQRVYHQHQTYIPWNGTWLGVNLPDGTYYYILFFEKDKQNEFMKGDITILR